MNFKQIWILCFCFFSLSCISEQTSIENTVGKTKNPKMKASPKKESKNNLVGTSKKEKILFYLNNEAVFEQDYRQYLYIRFGKSSLKDFITERLIFTKSQHLGIQINKEELEEWVGQKVQESMVQMGGRKKLGQMIRKQYGLSLKEFVDNIRQNAPLMVTLTKILQHYRMKDKSLKMAYEQKFGSKIQLKQIFFPFHSAYMKMSDQLAKKRITKVLQKIRSKKITFTQGVTFYSEAESAKKKGALDWVKMEKLDPDIKSAIQDKPPGTVIGPIKTRHGYHIAYYKKRATFVKLYHIYISNHFSYRLSEEKKKNIQKEVQEKAKLLYEKIKKEDLPFEEALLQNPQNFKPTISFRRFACPLGKKVEKLAFGLALKEVSSPVVSKSGIYIFRLEKKGKPLRPFDLACKNDLKKIVKEEKITEEEIVNLKNKLEKESKIRFVQ